MEREVPDQALSATTSKDMSPQHKSSEAPQGPEEFQSPGVVTKSEAPKKSEMPNSLDTSRKLKKTDSLEAPKKLEKPDDSDASKKSEMPDDSDAPRRSELPNRSDAPKNSEIPNSSDALQKSETPKGSESPQKSTSPKRSKSPQKSKACKGSESPRKSSAPKGSKSPQKSTASKGSVSPQESDPPKTSTSAKKPESPKKSAVPKEGVQGSRTARSTNQRKPRRYDDELEPLPRVPNPLGHDKLKVMVTGYPHYTQAPDLARAFSKFGDAKVTSISSQFATVAFGSEKEASDAIHASRKVNVYGEFLAVKPYNDQRAAELVLKPSPKREFPKSKQKTVIIEPTQIDLNGPFCEQLERVLAAVRLTQEDVEALSTLYTDLERVLRLQWPGCTAIPFGSITTGLGIKTSDADCFIHVPAQYRHPHANFINKAKKILQQYPHVFDELLSIPRANTPIVKLFHVPTGTNCDLTFKTPLGAQNSKLIAFLLHADPRLLPVAVIVKYWAKVHELTGTGKLSNYGLTMLIIFYLQQPPISILPSVEWLQRDAANDVVVDFWNTGFMNKKDKLPECTNTSSISELLGGFFEYYSLFNFEEMVVCPFLGYPIKKDTFSDLGLVLPQFQRYKNNVLANLSLPLRSNTPVCVQDPFEQCHNVASTVTHRLGVELKAYFKFAANAYEKEKLNNCEKFLQSILLEKPKIARARSHPEYRVNLFPRIIVAIIDPDWKPVVRDIVFTVFENILKIKLGKVEEKLNPDTKKEKEKYMGYVTKAIWKRKQFSRLYSLMTLDFTQKQAKITEEIIKVDKEVYNIQFQLTVTYCHDPRSAVVAIKLGTGDLTAFREFGKFFISVMQSWFISLLKPHARPAEIDTAAKIAETIRMLDSHMDAPESDDDTVLPLVVTNSSLAVRNCGNVSGNTGAASPPPADGRPSPPQCY